MIDQNGRNAEDDYDDVNGAHRLFPRQAEQRSQADAEQAARHRG